MTIKCTVRQTVASQATKEYLATDDLPVEEAREFFLDTSQQGNASHTAVVREVD
jgi:hypothetical protein